MTTELTWVQAVEDTQTMRKCETCDGLGYFDERLGGESFSNPNAQCPDCGGSGEYSNE